MNRHALTAVFTAVIVLGLALGACRRADPLADLGSKPRPTADSAEACAQLHGQWFQPAGGGARGTVCIVPTPDAGQACRDTRDCATFCEQAPDQKPDEPVRGVCHANYELRGCHVIIDGGVIAAQQCID